jgi:3-hydroxybutyryl-CoA dehydrogenase
MNLSFQPPEEDDPRDEDQMNKLESIMIIGPGTMGLGIAQLAAQHGHEVLLYARNLGATLAKDKLRAVLDGLVAKGKMTILAQEELLGNITPIYSLSEGRDVDIVIEAIVEEIVTKKDMLKEIEMVVSPNCVIATNTSSISLTALSNGMAHPTRLVGMHFFNPVPLMKLVEIISGMHTSPVIAAVVEDLAKSWGKTPVHGKSTPGFIVNRIARPYYAETLALLQEQAASPQVIDACLRGAGFKMGPCELMDLIGHDTNFAVTSSIYAANFYDKRFVPSLVQQELVEGGLLGRKTKRGFYKYPEGAPALEAVCYTVPDTHEAGIEVHGTDATADYIAERLTQLGYKFDRVEHDWFGDWTGLLIADQHYLMMSLCGQTAYEIQRNIDTKNVAVFDEAISKTDIAYAVATTSSQEWKDDAPRWLALLGFKPHLVADTPGLIVARTISMLINEAADAVRQGVCTVDAANTAMKLGVNYPKGPFEWLDDMTVLEVAMILDSLHSHYAGERYRTSPYLKERVTFK